MADIATISNMRAKANILIVDDDPVIAYLIKELLEKEGFQALVCFNARDALNELERNSFDLALCDIMMPGMDGFELCRRIRNVSKMPIILISAKNETIDKVSGLTLGADDYITKPFEHYELIARIKSHLRRADWNKEPASSAQILAAQNLVLDPAGHVCQIDSTPVNLTPKEFSLLFVLMNNPQTPHSIQELYEEVWKAPYDESGGNAVMVHIRRLRKKLADVDNSRTYITTAWGIGYKMQL